MTALTCGFCGGAITFVGDRGFCRRHGDLGPAQPIQVQPDAVYTERDLDMEHVFTEAVAALLNVDVDAEHLNAFALERAGNGPISNLLTRSMGREAAEELADARNYACWWVQQRSLRPDVDLRSSISGEIHEQIMLGLGHVAAAYAAVAAARALEAQERGDRWHPHDVEAAAKASQQDQSITSLQAYRDRRPDGGAA